MGFGVSLLLIAIGAILIWGVQTSVSGVELSTIGVILMIVGGVGFIASLLLSSRMPWRSETVVAGDRHPVERVPR